jgi:hypothetical protein
MLLGDILYQVRPITIDGLPESVRDEIIWADRVELLRTVLPVVIAISLVVAPIVFLIKLVRPDRSNMALR